MLPDESGETSPSSASMSVRSASPDSGTPAVGRLEALAAVVDQQLFAERAVVAKAAPAAPALGAKGCRGPEGPAYPP